jgi:hypothetical protein
MKRGVLYMPDGADGGDGSAGAQAASAALDDGGQQQQQADGGEGQQQQEQVKETPASVLTADALAQAMKAAGIGAQQQQNGGQQQYTEADFDKAFHVVRPTKDQVAKILAGGDDALTIFTDLLHATAKQGVVMSAYQLQQLKEEMTKQLSPIQQWHQSEVDRQMRAEFVEKNTDLKGFEVVGEEVVKAMRAEGVQFKSKAEAFTAIRDRIVKTIKALPGFENWKPGDKQQQQQNGAKANMATLSRGGGSGGAAAGQGGGSKVAGAGLSRGTASVGAAVFDN